MTTMLKVLVLLGCLVLSGGCFSTKPRSHDPYWSASAVKRSRIYEVTVPEIEAGKNPGMPVPEASPGWDNFKRQVLPGDKLWYFCVPAASWKDAIGWRGYALYRADRLIATFTVADD